ncbi:SRPBCC family protein [Paenisporosarcina cavernae]|uniref:SRPBCC domain-containing protein n=1 Tax=Paenisporosarcina cavernae TaxID=2320858 RepID=A0A385YV09_9BACL|nr:SRPBCC domain-containing protein [Paenisporosarcina cavernae]AYC30526.1 SRPBCC domain-containing protein [Paenisporosarcina cavernae]
MAELGKNTVTVDGSTLVIERLIDAPKEKVFRAFSESDQLAAWWGPQGWETENKAFNFTPGGEWHYGMTCNDPNQGDFYGQTSWGKATFEEIDAPNRVQYVDAFSDDAGTTNSELPVMRIVNEFEEQDGKTLFRTTSEFPTEEELKQVMEMGMLEGFSSQMERLDAYLNQ